MGLIWNGHTICKLLVAAALLAGSMGQSEASGVDRHEPQIEYDLRIAEAESDLVRVRAEISGAALGNARTLVLNFRDLHRHPGALKQLHAQSNDQPLPVEIGYEGQENLRTIALSGASGSVIIDYTVDPTFYPPGPRTDDPADARARVAEEIAVLRTSSIFPILNRSFASARVTFTLPEKWVVVAPWAREGDGFWLSPEDQSAVDYVGLGLLEVSEVTVGNTGFLVGAPGQESGLGAEQATAIIRYYLDLVGTPPTQGSGMRSVILVPSHFMQGGAAGNRSIVQGASAVVLAHEAFHWWTHSDLVRPQAKWFSEGFTNYYGIKAASETELITEQEATQCLTDLAGEMRYLESDGTQSLASVSESYGQDRRAQRLVYSKGTMLALFLHRELENRDRSLDEVIKAILSQRRRGLTNANLRRFIVKEYGKDLGSLLDGFVKKAGVLPDFGLGSATGSSGCARFLPER